MSYLPTGPQSDCSPRNPAELRCVHLGQVPIRLRHVLPCTRYCCENQRIVLDAMLRRAGTAAGTPDSLTACWCFHGSICVLWCLRRNPMLQHASCKRIIVDMSKNMCKAQDVQNVSTTNSNSHRCSATAIRTKQSTTSPGRCISRKCRKVALW
jgi:hypothetical protein